jgi:hypothetical protein
MATNPATIQGLPPPPPGFSIDTAPPVVPIIPRTPAPQTPAQASKDVSDASSAASNAETAQNNAKISAFKVKEEGLTEGKQQAQKDMMTAGVDNLVSSIEDAKGLVNGWSTGLPGDALQHIGGTDAAKLKALIDQEVKGNVFLTTLQQRQQDNPNGGGNGSPGGRVLQSEVPMITGALGTLDPAALGPTMTTQKLNQIAYRALRSKAILNGEDPNNPDVQKKYGIDKYAAQLPPQDIVGPPPGGNGASPPPVGGSPPPLQRDSNGNVIYAPTGVESAGLATNTKTVSDPVLKAANSKVSEMIAGGASAKDVTDYLTGLGVDVNRSAGGVPSIADQTAQAVAWRAKHPNYTGGYDVHLDERQVPTTTWNKIASSGPSTAMIAAGDLVSGGHLDNAIGATGGSADLANLGIQAAEAEHPYWALGGNLAGGATVYGLGGAGLRAAGLAPEAATGAERVVQAFAPRAIAGDAAAGGYMASGQGGTQIIDPANTAAGAALAAGTGIAARGAIGAVKPTAPIDTGTYTPNEIGQAMLDEGIPGARPIADPSVRAKMTYLETTQGGNNVVREGLDQTRRAIADKVADVAGPGTVQTPGAMGEAIQDAGTRTLQGMKDNAKAVYTQADQASQGAAIHPTEALGKLDSYISQLSRNPETNAGVLSYLQGIRNDLAAPGGKTVGDIRDIITGANDKINFQNLQKTRAEGIMADVTGSLNNDVARDLGSSSPQALSLYNKADGMWRDMSNLRQQVVQKLIGPANNPISGEQTLNRVSNMMNNKGDLQRFNRVMGMMTPEEKSDFAATLFNNIGQRSADEPFSPAYFLSQTKNMQPDALKTVFGEEGARSIQNLRVASQGFKEATGQLNNSRSGLVANWKSMLGSVLSMKNAGAAAAGYEVAGAPGAAAAVIGSTIAKPVLNRMSAKTLMNPDVSQWIRAASKAQSPSQIKSMIGKLDNVGNGNAAIQGELQPIRNAIAQFANDNFGSSGRAAASPNGGPNQQQQTNGSAPPTVGQ